MKLSFAKMRGISILYIKIMAGNAILKSEHVFESEEEVLFFLRESSPRSTNQLNCRQLTGSILLVLCIKYF